MFLLSNLCKLSLPLGLEGVVSLDFREERLAKMSFTSGWSERNALDDLRSLFRR